MILKTAPDADFRQIGNLFIVSFPRPWFLDQEGDGAPATQEKIIAALLIKPTLTRKLLSQRIGILEDGVKYHLNKLRITGRSRHVGQRGGTAGG